MAEKKPVVRDVTKTVLQGTTKRRIMTQQLVGKFSSKADFIKYFSENCKYFSN